MAEVKPVGTQLQFGAFTVYPAKGDIPKNSILTDIITHRRDFITAAKDNGFTEIRIIGERVKNSSSANPDITIDRIIKVK